jgi:NADPH:quinone reductase-like Zn-dependent oxidoreductase
LSRYAVDSLAIADNAELSQQVEAVALNPGDWKVRDWMSKPGDLHGCDFSGSVVDIGEEVTTVKVGDRVASFVLSGSFAEHVKTKAVLIWKIPDSVDWEQAAALGAAAGESGSDAQRPKLTLLIILQTLPSTP